MVKRTITMLMALLLTAMMSTAAFAATLEQAQVRLPLIDVYLYNESGSVTDEALTANLGSEQLKLENSQPFSQTGQGVYYVFMLDTSSSVPQKHFTAAKNAIIAFNGTKGMNDKLALIAFGDTVSVLLTGDETKAQADSVISSVVGRDMNTHFYDAMDQLVALTDKVSGMRKVAVVVSDGLDDTRVGMTQQEAEKKIINSGVSVNTLCVDTAPKAGVDSLGQFSRQSGGNIYLYSAATAGDAINQLQQHLNSCTYVQLRSFDALADGSATTLSINQTNSDIQTLEVALSYELQDDIAPEVETVEYSTDTGAIRVTFSEPVRGADNPSAYSFVSGRGKRIALAGATYIENGEHRIVDVMPVETPSKGKYILTLSGISDNTMKANALDVQELEVSLDTGVFGGLPIWGWIACVLGLAVLAAGVVLARAIIVKRREAEARFETATSCYTEDYKQHIKQGKGVAIEVEINDGRNTVTKTEFKLISSLILGRADYCDVVFEDRRISGQHCALEYENGSLCVSDLESMNGTAVNGISISGKRSLNVDDVIGIGDTNIKIKSIG